MKRKILLFSLCVLTLTLSLTSCKVNWFDKQYDAPWWAVLIPAVLLVASVALATGKYIASKEFVCPKCGGKFHPKWWISSISLHIGSDRYFKCPHCGKRRFCHVSRKNKEE